MEMQVWAQVELLPTVEGRLSVASGFLVLPIRASALVSKEYPLSVSG